MEEVYQYRGATVNVCKDLVTDSYFWGIQYKGLISSYGPFSKPIQAKESAEEFVDSVQANWFME